MMDKFKFKNNKGQMTIFMIILLVVLLLAAVLLLVGGIASQKIDDALNIDLDIGQTNLADVNADTWGKFNEMVVVGADWWGISLIFGLVLALFLSAYLMRNSMPKWGIIIDIFIILFIFFISLYLSSSYQSILDGLALTGETFLEDVTPKTSMFILNLPVFVVIIGVIMMILFHSAIPRRTEERIQEGGFLQGVG